MSMCTKPGCYFWVCVQVTVITKTEEDDVSTLYTLNNTGGVISQKPSHLGQGKL